VLFRTRHTASIVRNALTPNDHYSGRTAPLTSKHCILYIYPKNTCTAYFKHGIYSPFSCLENAVCFIILKFYNYNDYNSFGIADMLKIVENL
jgi:hypothetical protein